MNATKTTLLQALRVWVGQRPGLEYANYGDVKGYRAELRGIARDKADFQILAAAVDMAHGITADDLREVFPRAYCGRLSLVETDNGAVKLDYTTGQYWPTEYRRAACAVLARALWVYLADGAADGNEIRAKARRLFGRGLAARWFN